MSPHRRSSRHDRRRPRALVGALALLALALPTTAATAAPDPGPAPDADERALVAQAEDDGPITVVVELRDGRERGRDVRTRNLAADVGARTVRTYDAFPYAAMRADADAIRSLATSPDVAKVHPNRTYRPTLDSSTAVIGADVAHRRGVDGSGQTVAVLDTGIDGQHEFFDDRVVAESCHSNASGLGRTLCPGGGEDESGPGSADAMTPACLDGEVSICDHGSHVAGTAAGGGGGNAPAAGVAPGAGIIAVQVFTRYDDPEICDGVAPCVASNTADILAGLDDVAALAGEHAVAAVNLSLGSPENNTDHCPGDPVAGAFGTLVGAGVAPVVSAGNEGHQAGVGSPACVEAAVTVGATADDDSVAGFSNRGVLLDVFAPGVDVTSSVPTATHDAYAPMQGTSMAAPHVAGALAVLRQEMPDASVGELVELLRDTGADVTYDSGGTQVTTPRIDLAEALPRIPTVVTWSGPDAVANGASTELSAVLTEESADGPPVAGAEVTLSLGAGDDRQACTGETDASGEATCTVVPDQPLTDDATLPVGAEFAGDDVYEPSSTSDTVLLEHYTGRASGLSASVGLPLLDLEIDREPDTGPVRTAQATTTDTPCTPSVGVLVLRAGGLCPEVTTSLDPGTSTATSSVGDVRIGLPGLPVIEVEGLTATSTSTCADGGSAEGSVGLTLKVGAKTVPVDPGVGVEVDLPGAARIVVNEQTPVPGADHGLTVNAVHVTALGGLADVVVGTATSDVHHCAG
ncbi:choice-of-anchor P family protein [Isoptericola cucumis]|uniref:choice-of-anchor P family protein n=1 Tax=Isoptericola cucumis TaxID=1776856 RepID=UPI00320A03A3